MFVCKLVYMYDKCVLFMVKRKSDAYGTFQMSVGIKKGYHEVGNERTTWVSELQHAFIHVLHIH